MESLTVVDKRHSSALTTEEYERMKELAANVAHNDHLAQILKAADAGMRKDVYNLLRPNLKFKPKPYFLLAKAWTN